MKQSLSLMSGALAFSLLLSASSASAHVKMLKPAPWLNEDSAGGPQKGGPCGPGGKGLFGDDVQPVPVSGAITTFTAGQKIKVEWKETVAHPGYYRIALAENRADLKDPTVPFTSMPNCNVDHSKIPTTPHDNVLADGIMITDNADERPGFPNLSYEITLPNKPCEKCTLQLIQFMEKHPPGCIYYHCADIKIVAAGGDAGVAADAGTADAGSGADAGVRSDSGVVGTGGGTTGGTAGGQGPGSSVGGGAMTGGATTGGTAPSTGGAAGGVAGSAGGSAAGAAGGTAGSAGGTTGATGLTAGAGGTVSGAPSAADDDDASCSMSPGATRGNAGVLMLSLLGAGLLLRRRRSARSSVAQR